MAQGRPTKWATATITEPVPLGKAGIKIVVWDKWGKKRRGTAIISVGGIRWEIAGRARLDSRTVVPYFFSGGKLHVGLLERQRASRALRGGQLWGLEAMGHDFRGEHRVLPRVDAPDVATTAADVVVSGDDRFASSLQHRGRSRGGPRIF